MPENLTITPILRRVPYGIFKKAVVRASKQEKPFSSKTERRLESEK